MSNQLNISASGLKKSLDKALNGSALERNVSLAAKAASQIIAGANQAQYPDLQTGISRTGKFSFALSFTAPMLWARAFGSQLSPAQPFITNVISGGLRGEA